MSPFLGLMKRAFSLPAVAVCIADIDCIVRCRCKIVLVVIDRKKLIRSLRTYAFGRSSQAVHGVLLQWGLLEACISSFIQIVWQPCKTALKHVAIDLNLKVRRME
jgi:hypothetical protein